MRTGDTVSIKCYLPVSQIHIHIYPREWYMVRIAMYFGNVRENTDAVRRGGNYCVVLTAWGVK